MRRRGVTRPVSMDDPLLTIVEAARYLNVSVGTVKYWTYRTRYLPHIRLGPGGESGRKLCRIRKSVLDALIARGERPALRLVQGPKR
jgi:excisionase family DNA binding protein